MNWLPSSLTGVVKDLLRDDPRVLSVLGTVCGATTSDPVVALTFDDGPHRHNTEAILSVLATHAAQATFFVVGERAEAARSLVEEIVAAGHEIGLHGQVHDDLTRYSPRQAWRTIHEGRASLEQLTGKEVTFFRPPFGTQGLVSYTAVRAAGMDAVGWTSSARDFYALELDRHVSIGLAELSRGGILLLHDGPPSAPDRQATLVGRLLDAIGELGWTGMRVGALLDGREAYRRLWFRHREAALLDEVQPLLLTEDAARRADRQSAGDDSR